MSDGATDLKDAGGANCRTARTAERRELPYGASCLTAPNGARSIAPGRSGRDHPATPARARFALLARCLADRGVWQVAPFGRSRRMAVAPYGSSRRWAVRAVGQFASFARLLG